MRSALTLFSVLGLFLLLSVGGTGQARSVCGDANDDGSVNVGDLVYLISYIFHQGPPPIDPTAGDLDLCGGIDNRDVDYLMDWIFSGGPDPCAGGVDCN